MAPALPYVDLSSPHAQRRAARNIRNVYDATPDEVKNVAAHWYDQVHEATAKGAHESGLTTRQGAGVVAAVSPNMDWEKNNIDAFHELRGLSGRQWSAVRDSANAGGSRTPQAREALQGLGVSAATDNGLMKAHAIMHEGRDFEEVMPRQTAPKTNSFARNIYNPHESGPVTIDGRAHDIAADRLQGWTTSRGIQSAALKTGKTTRYEHFEAAYRTAAAGLTHPEERRPLRPHELQAVTWVQGKNLERQGTTKAGLPRTNGVRRTGQSYSSLIG